MCISLLRGVVIVNYLQPPSKSLKRQAIFRECMNELCTLTVSLESHKDNLVLCNLVCENSGACACLNQRKNKSMTDIIMCQKIYGQGGEEGRGKLESIFPCSSSFLELLSLALSTCLSEVLEVSRTKNTHIHIIPKLYPNSQ